MLVYSKKSGNESAQEKREYFLHDIQQEGLELEIEEEVRAEGAEKSLPAARKSEMPGAGGTADPHRR